MTYYHQQVIHLRRLYFPCEQLCDQIVQAKKYIDNHFSSDIRLPDIALAACCSKFHFLRLFKQVYGRTPHRYLTERRIEKACELLAGGLPVSDACFSVGFESVGSFKSLFKKYTGYTPRDWQNRQPPICSGAALRYLPCFAASKNSNIQDR